MPKPGIEPGSKEPHSFILPLNYSGYWVNLESNQDLWSFSSIFPLNYLPYPPTWNRTRDYDVTNHCFSTKLWQVNGSTGNRTQVTDL
jgi:hypothetical protein